MTNSEDTRLDQVQASGIDTGIDRGLREPHLLELVQGHEPMLLRRMRRDHLIHAPCDRLVRSCLTVRAHPRMVPPSASHRARHVRRKAYATAAGESGRRPATRMASKRTSTLTALSTRPAAPAPTASVRSSGVGSAV